MLPDFTYISNIENGMVVTRDPGGWEEKWGIASLPAALGKYIPKRESSDTKYYNLYSSTKFW